MRSTLFSTLLILLIVLTPYLPNTFAQDHIRWDLPVDAKARLGKGYIYEIRYAPDGTQLAAATSLGIWLYDARTGKERNLLTDHTSSVHSVAFNPDGQTLASGNADGIIHLWDVNTGEYLKTLTGHRDIVKSLAFSPDGRILASASVNGIIYLWNVRTNEHLTPRLIDYTDFVTSLVFSPDGQTLASAAGRLPIERVFMPGITDPVVNDFLVDEIGIDIPDGIAKNFIRLWDTNTGEKKETLTGHTDIITNLAFSPDGQTLASASWDTTVRLWDTNTGEPKETLTGHTDIIINLAFSPNGQILAGANWKEIHLWDAVARTHLKTLTGLTFIDAGIDASDDHLARTQLKILTGFIVDENPRRSHPPDVAGDVSHSLAFSPDGQTLAGADGGEIHLWDTDIWTYLKTFTKHTNLVTSLALSPNGAVLASGSWKEVHLWDTDTGTHLKTLRGPRDIVRSLAFSPDGATLASSSGGEIHLWDTDTSTHLKTFTGSQDIVRTLVFGPDGTTLAGVGWPRSTKGYIIDLWDIVTGTHRKTVTGQDDFIHIIRSGNSLWDAHNGAPIQLLVGTDRHSWALSTDGRTSAGGNADGGIVLWGKTTHTYLKTFIGPPMDVNHVAFSADGSALVSSSIDGTMFLWDLTSVPIEKIPGDVTKDGIVNIQDLTLVAANFGQTGPNVADINTDGIVNIADLTLVAGVIGAEAAAPSIRLQALAMLTTVDVQQWLAQAQQLNLNDPISQRGIRFLEQLLDALTPKETALLPNYPNPFNPETWIPYQLAEPADVTLTIYAINGQIVRQMAFGYQAAGVYQTPSRAAHWDGKNELGEPVASGIYFYTLTAGKFKATRKMLVRQ